MKFLYAAVLFFGLSQGAMSQRTMITHKHDGTKDYITLAVVDSVTFEMFASVAGGTFTAGSTSTTISSFTIDRYEVTYELWTAVATWGAAHGYTDLAAGTNGYRPVGTSNPVTSVSWYDIVKWCNARSEKDGLSPVYYTTNTLETVYKTGVLPLLPDCVKWTANGYRLPTEAEWEFAAKGGTHAQATPYTYSGSNTLGDVAWQIIDGNTSHGVGLKKANELGLYDMSGNVWEWCWDWYYGAAYPSGGASDPQGPITAQHNRVLRGGSWDYGGDYCRSTTRFSIFPEFSDVTVGFRCVQD